MANQRAAPQWEWTLFSCFALLVTCLTVLVAILLAEEWNFGWQISFVGTKLVTNHPSGVAVCIAGNLRTFTVPVVFSQIRPFHEKLWGSKVSFFLYGTLAGAGPKNQTNHNLPAINESNQTALNIAVTLLRPETVELVTNAEDVTEENIAQYVLHQARVSKIVHVKSDNPWREYTISNLDLI